MNDPRPTQDTIIELEYATKNFVARPLAGKLPNGDGFHEIKDRLCTNHQYTYTGKLFKVSPNRELYIMDGPYVDEDLCTGQQGRLLVDIFDNKQWQLKFLLQRYFDSEF